MGMMAKKKKKEEEKKKMRGVNGTQVWIFT